MNFFFFFADSTCFTYFLGLSLVALWLRAGTLAVGEEKWFSNTIS